MKRSDNVSLMLMGAAAFAATFAGGMAYFALQKPSHAAQAQTAAEQQCSARSEGTQECEPRRRGFAYYVFPHFTPGWTWSSGWGWGSSYGNRQSAALSNNPRTYAPASGRVVERSGFGSTARAPSIRVSAGG